MVIIHSSTQKIKTTKESVLMVKQAQSLSKWWEPHRGINDTHENA